MSALRAHLPAAAPERSDPPLERRRIGGIAVAATDAGTAIGLLEERLDDLRFTKVAFANAHCVNVASDSSDYRQCLGDFTVFADGVGVDLASKLLYGVPFPENLNGTDFVPKLLKRMSGRRRVALVGAAPGVAEDAARNLAARFPRHEFVVASHGFFKPGLETEIVLARLRRLSPDITLVALGVPRQELFIAERLTLRETTVAIGVGALLDFLSGRVPRAPPLWRTLRLEWVHRLLNEPSRLWRRYILGNPRFLLGVLADWNRRRTVKG
ncbi:UDP-N-acetyl-D-mannosaminuronic acid transferase [Aureimonas endophytica]|uniref:UDP-N-acetyl-D-mannosaminuronic acid transferase n=1 Tax=Aureimonas endophytica TaxID=2027858 RepID=A0A916ZGQ0_9HYPH|nr:WecB/TagA/CpsF family glycosyltransferase [Aureimonas endophytica]GGD96896.1 UDP-N-acetyl-D-mannosaminuronic acid transferase [Aureimonas endophytica]